MATYQIFNPGEYCDFERELVQERLDLASGKKKFEPPKEMLEFMPMTPKPYTEAEIIAFNKIWNPYDPLYNDPDYARSQGFPSVPAMPGFAKPMGGMMLGFPKDMAERFFYTHDGGTFEIRDRIFAGDLLTNTKSITDFRDVTVPGSDVRIWYMGSYNEMSNQRGEVVLAGEMNTRDAYKKCIDGTDNPTFSEKMEAWYDILPPAHYTTDEEWDYIRELWAKEEIRGENTLYWEDVEIGYEAPKTCSGPITYMHMIEWYGAKAPTATTWVSPATIWATGTTPRDAWYGTTIRAPIMCTVQSPISSATRDACPDSVGDFFPSLRSCARVLSVQICSKR
jgi:hypothetical protein